MPAVNKVYRAEWSGDRESTTMDYALLISDNVYTSYTGSPADRDYVIEAPGAVVDYNSNSSDPFDPIKSSTCSFSLKLSDATDESTLDAIYNTNNDVNWYVQIWKSVGGASYTLDWYGYLQTNINNRPNVHYDGGLFIKMEAQDQLSLMKNQKIFDAAFTTPLVLPGLGITVKIPKFRFGASRVTTITTKTSYPKRKPTIIDAVYSLLYDLDVDLAGNLNTICEWDDGQSGNPFARTTIPLWSLLFNDPVNSNPLHIPWKKKEGVTSGEILKRICELFCCRIFQEGGVYWLVQSDAYQNGGTLTYYKYTKRGTGTTGEQPQENGSSTLTTSQYLLSVASPQTTPKILAGSAWERLQPLHGITITGTTGGNVVDVRSKITANVTSNNLSDLARNEKEITTDIPATGIEIVIPGASQRQKWTRNGIQLHTYEACITNRMEGRNGYRKIFGAGLWNTEMSMLKGLSYDGIVYITDTLKINTDKNEYKGQFIEIALETGNLTEVENEAIDQEELDAFMQKGALIFIERNNSYYGPGNRFHFNDLVDFGIGGTMDALKGKSL